MDTPQQKRLSLGSTKKRQAPLASTSREDGDIQHHPSPQQPQQSPHGNAETAAAAQDLAASQTIDAQAAWDTNPKPTWAHEDAQEHDYTAHSTADWTPSAPPQAPLWLAANQAPAMHEGGLWTHKESISAEQTDARESVAVAPPNPTGYEVPLGTLVQWLAIGGLPLLLAKEVTAAPATANASSGQLSLAGTITAGPTVVGNGLWLRLYDPNGNLLAQVKVGDNGGYSLVVRGYSGIAIVKLFDLDAGAADYEDEATGQPKDIGVVNDSDAVLQAIAVVTDLNGNGQTVHVNPLTTIAATLIAQGSLTAQNVQATNAAVSQLFGLGADITQEGVVAINDPAYSTASDSAKKAGTVLAAISAYELQGAHTTPEAVDLLADQIQVNGDSLSLASTVREELMVAMYRSIGQIGRSIIATAQGLFYPAPTTAEQKMLDDLSLASALTPSSANSLSADIIQALSAIALTLFSPATLAALSTQQLRYLSAEQMAILSSAQVQALSLAQLATLSPAQIEALSNAVLAGLNASQIHALSSAQLAALNSSQTQSLSTEALGSLNQDQWNAVRDHLSAEQQQALQNQSTPTAQQVQDMSSQAIAALTPNQIAGLSTQAIASLSTTQTAALDSTQLSRLSSSQIDALTSTQVSTLSTSQVAGLSSTQIGALGSDLDSLSNAALEALTSAQVAGITASQVDELSAPQIAALGSDVAGLSTAAVQSLDSAQVAALSTDQVQALTTAQAQALSSAQVAALGSDIDSLGSAALEALTSAQVAGITAAQIDELSTAQIAALGSDVAGLSTAAVQSLDSAQLAALSTNQVEALTSTQVSALTTDQAQTLSSTQVAALGSDIDSLGSAALEALTSTQVAGITAAQVDELSPSQITALGSDVTGLSTAAVQSLDSAQVAALSTDQIQALTSAQVQALSTDQLETLSSTQLAGLTASQVDELSTAQIAALGSDVAGLNTAAVQSLDSAQLAALSTNQVEALTSTQVSALTTAQAQAFSSTQITALGSDIASLSNAALEAFSSAQLAGVTATQIDGLSGLQVAALGSDLAGLSTAAVQSLDSAQVAALTTTQVQALTSAQVAALSTDQIQALTSTQVSALTATQAQAFSSTQITALGSDIAGLNSAALEALSSAQLAGVTAAQIDGLSGPQIAALGADLVGLDTLAVQSLDSAQLNALSGTQVAALSSAQIDALSSDQVRNLGILQIQAFSSAQIGALGNDISSFTTAALDALSSTQLAGVTGAQIDVLSAAQIVALGNDILGLSLAALQSLDAAQAQVIDPLQFLLLSNEQLQSLQAQLSVQQQAIVQSIIDARALTPEQGALLTATDIDGLNRYAVASLSSAVVAQWRSEAVASLDGTQVDGLNYNQITAFSSTQVQALASDALASLDGTQLSAMGTAQLDALNSAQVQVLTTTALFALSSAQLAVLRPDMSTAQLAAFNHAPVAALTPPNQSTTTGTGFAYTLPANTFTDADDDSLTWTASLADGSALPSWLSFNASTHSFSGTPTGPSSVSLKVSVSDGYGGTASVAFGLTVSTPIPLAMGFVINGQSAGDYSGRSVAGAGDVNGDGLADLVVGAYLSDPTGASNGGRSYVVFGKASSTAVNLSAVAAGTGTGGFVINGQCANDGSAFSVMGAGDVNGDGLADLIVGAYLGDPNAGTNAGRSYVVFGKTSAAAVDLSAIAAGTGGFVINGQGSSDFSGYSVSAAGDVNGDGLADVIVGAYQNDPTAGLNAGRSYVVFGKTDTTAIELSAVATGAGGFVINGQCSIDQSGISVSAAGDVNGDGLGDVIVGANQSDPTTGFNAGRSYVVFGKTSTSAIELSAIAAGTGTGGFVINGQCSLDQSGISVSAAGDVNGDGLADLIVGANQSDPNAGADAGRSYVVFGKTSGTAIELSAIAAGTGGFVINGQCSSDNSGFSVSAAGDVNGDGLGDLIVGANLSDPAAGANAGRSYVVFGKTSGTAIELSAVATGSGGFVINGQCSNDQSGTSVSAAGDVNGDGLADLIVGANLSDPSAGVDAGRSYVVFGKTDTTAVNLSDIATGSASTTLSVALNGSSSNDTWTGTTAGEIALGAAGDDTLTGGGGADVLYGGAGNDVIVLGASNVAALSLGFNSSAALLARVDGGSGIDTLQLSGSANLDLTAIANAAAGDIKTGGRIASIEKIDLANASSNTLSLKLQDLLDMSGMNVFNNTSLGGATLGAAVNKHQLLITADAADTVRIDTAGWTNSGSTVNANGHSYAIWNHNSAAAQLLIDQLATTQTVL